MQICFCLVYELSGYQTIKKTTTKLTFILLKFDKPLSNRVTSFKFLKKKKLFKRSMRIRLRTALQGHFWVSVLLRSRFCGFLDSLAVFSHPETLFTVWAGGHRHFDLIAAVAAKLESFRARARFALPGHEIINFRTCAENVYSAKM